MPILSWDAAAAAWQAEERARPSSEDEEQVAALEETAGAWSDRNHPEMRTDEDIDRWLADLRSSWHHSRFITCDLDRQVAERAGDLIRQSRDRQVALDMPDAIVAATALANGLTLVTLNPADFEGISGRSMAPLPEEGAP